MNPSRRWTWLKIVDALKAHPLSENQRHALNGAVRAMTARRRNGGGLHNPHHYTCQILALARKFEIVAVGDIVSGADSRRRYIVREDRLERVRG